MSNHQTLQQAIQQNDILLAEALNILECDLRFQALVKQHANKAVSSTEYNPQAYGKILILGATKVSKSAILAIGEKYGFSKDRFEFVLDYKAAKAFDTRKLRYNPKYALIIVCAVPHSTVGTTGYSSEVAALKSIPGFPPVVHTPRPSKTSFEAIFSQQLQLNVLAS